MDTSKLNDMIHATESCPLWGIVENQVGQRHSVLREIWMRWLWKGPGRGRPSWNVSLLSFFALLMLFSCLMTLKEPLKWASQTMRKNLWIPKHRSKYRVWEPSSNFQALEKFFNLSHETTPIECLTIFYWAFFNWRTKNSCVSIYHIPYSPWVIHIY